MTTLKAYHHLLHYILLGIVLFVGAGLFFFYRGYPVVQLLVGIATAVLYTLWGVIHHYLDRDLTVKVIIEYLVVSIFVIVILWNVLIV